MSHDEYIVSQAFRDAVDRRVEVRLRELGLDAAAVGARGARIDARHEAGGRIAWKALRALLIVGGSLGIGGTLLEFLKRIVALF